MMELESFPEELRRRALEVGQVLRMELFPEDSVRPKKGKSSKEKRFVIIGKDGDTVVAAFVLAEKCSRPASWICCSRLLNQI